MFTFYDNQYGQEEKVWNVCYNEVLNKWITFYSWVPSYSEAINNLYFSFDRTTSKLITKLGVSSELSEDADGICLSEVVFTPQSLLTYYSGGGVLSRCTKGVWSPISDKSLNLK
jgi:hypothetical protein